MAAKWDELLASAGGDPNVLANMTLSRAIASIKTTRPKGKTSRKRKPADQLRFSSVKDMEALFAECLERAKATEAALGRFLDESPDGLDGSDRCQELINQQIEIWSRAKAGLSGHRRRTSANPCEPVVAETDVRAEHAEPTELRAEPRQRRLIPNESAWKGMRQ